MSNVYDYIIIGGGPTGLTLALYLSKINKRCLIIDENSSLGGCHRVVRVDGNLFTEHGPRIYSSAYLNFKTVLNELNTDFETLFTRYNFTISNIGGKTLNQLSFREKLVFMWPFLNLVFTGGESLKYVSVGQYVNQFNYVTDDTKAYLDNLCRLTDGAGIDKYTMFQFLQLLNQNFYYGVYQPRQPNDQGLFKIWKDTLRSRGVEIQLNTTVDSFTQNADGTYTINGSTNSSTNTLTCQNLCMCIPPKPFLQLASKSTLNNGMSVSNAWSAISGLDMNEWAAFNSYGNYLPVSFHWKTKMELPKIWGFPMSDWRIAFIVLTDYMNADGNDGTVISTCVTDPNIPSKTSGKTANEYTNQQELIDEVFSQLKQAYPHLPQYDRAILNPNVSRDNGWVEKDTAYVATYKNQTVPQRYGNLFFVGTHNGYSAYNFTSMESAVTNAFVALNDIGFCLPIRKPKELKDTVRFGLFAVLLVVIFIIIFKKPGRKVK